MAVALAVAVLAAGCGGTAASQGVAPLDATRAPAATPAASVVAVVGQLVTFKSPTCGCCGGWERYMRTAGWIVDSRPTEEMPARKAELGVPDEASSCHTSVIQGYVVEGHVPLAAIEQLLRERPDIAGIALPGMEDGSPGMDGPARSSLAVVAIHRDGTTFPFGTFAA